MGFFGKKSLLSGLTPRQLREGTQVPLVDVEPGFVDYIRSTKLRIPNFGHEAPVALLLRGSEVVAVWDDTQVGKIMPSMVDMYIEEFRKLQTRKQYGLTSVFIKPKGFKSSHSVSLNWGTGAIGGGIL